MKWNQRPLSWVATSIFSQVTMIAIVGNYNSHGFTNTKLFLGVRFLLYDWWLLSSLCQGEHNFFVGQNYLWTKSMHNICDIAIANMYLSCLKINIISYKSIYVWVKYIESGSYSVIESSGAVLLRDRIIRGAVADYYIKFWYFYETK